VLLLLLLDAALGTLRKEGKEAVAKRVMAGALALVSTLTALGIKEEEKVMLPVLLLLLLVSFWLIWLVMVVVPFPLSMFCKEKCITQLSLVVQARPQRGNADSALCHHIHQDETFIVERIINSLSPLSWQNRRPISSKRIPLHYLEFFCFFSAISHP
jgi:hypothetical protein